MMYPDNAYYEFYPAEIVDRILAEHPDATVEHLNNLMQAEFDALKAKHPRFSMAECMDALGM